MNILNKPIVLKENEYRALAKMIYEENGISLGDNKQELVKSRLGKRLRILGMTTYSEYYDFVSNPLNHGEFMIMMNAISTNFTSFYREKKHFDFLLHEALPDIFQRKKKERSLRIRAWCAAASSGEEPYTLALTMLEFFHAIPRIDMKLLATDISTKALAEAADGIYSEEKVKVVGPIFLARYFDRVQGDKEDFFQVKKEVKDLITFRRLNLMDTAFPLKGPLDFIFCRNVMIYFDLSTQVTLVEKLLRLLARGGYLFIGHSENLPAVFRTRVDVLAPAIYRKG